MAANGLLGPLAGAVSAWTQRQGGGRGGAFHSDQAAESRLDGGERGRENRLSFRPTVTSQWGCLDYWERKQQ